MIAGSMNPVHWSRGCPESTPCANSRFLPTSAAWPVSSRATNAGHSLPTATLRSFANSPEAPGDVSLTCERTIPSPMQSRANIQSKRGRNGNRDCGRHQPTAPLSPWSPRPCNCAAPLSRSAVAPARSVAAPGRSRAFDGKGRLGEVYKLFGDRMDDVIDELNEVLAG